MFDPVTRWGVSVALIPTTQQSVDATLTVEKGMHQLRSTRDGYVREEQMTRAGLGRLAVVKGFFRDAL